MRRILAIVLSFLPSIFLMAQEQSLSITADREDIMIGEQINLDLVLTAATQDTVIFPAVGDTFRTEVEVIDRSKIDTTFTGEQLEQKVLKQSFVITSFDSGYFPVEPLRALVNGDTVESNPFLVAVQTVKIDTSKGIADIKEIQEVPFAWKEWFAQNWYWIALGIAIAGLITFVVFWLSKERKPKEVPEPVVPSRPPYEIASERLDRLRQQQLWENDKTKLYYSELTDILREYIELQYAIPALEQTTEEIIRSMQHMPDFSKDQVTKVKRLLFLTDLVKFAKEKPIGSENMTNFKIVEDFIQETHAAIKAAQSAEKDEAEPTPNANRTKNDDIDA